MRVFSPLTLALVASHGLLALAVPVASGGACRRKANPVPAPVAEPNPVPVAAPVAAPEPQPQPEPVAEPYPDPEADPDADPATTPATGTKFPFSHIVAFGDNLSDNGSGSVAHGVAQEGDPSNKIYGHSTWTNGPVAVSYLSKSLKMKLDDYAFGHANGGSLFGATIDNAYTKSTANAPSSKDQIANYTSRAVSKKAKTAMAFLWIGANDINLYHMWFSPTSDNTRFADQFSTMLAQQVQSLLDLGFPAVFVPNLYAKHISPSKHFYGSNEQQWEIMGKAIQQANDAIAAKLAKFGDRVVVYDAFGKMVQLWNDHAKYDITKVGDWYCDGYSEESWDLCVKKGQGSTFFWMQFLDPTTHVHRLLAKDMLNVVKKKFGKTS